MATTVKFELSRFLRESYEEQRVTGERNASFSAFRDLYNQVRDLALTRVKEYEDTAKKNRETYVRSIAEQKNLELKNALSDKIREYKRKLTEVREGIKASKEAEKARYVTIPPDEETFRMLQMMQLRGKHMTDADWELYVKKIAETGNYSALKYASELSEEFGKTFVVPFKTEEATEEIEAVDEAYQYLIAHLDTPDDKLMYKYNIYRLEGNTTKAVDELDSRVGITVPEQKSTILGRLTNARKYAVNMDRNDIANEISRFIYANTESLERGTNLSSFVGNEAERLIKLAFDSKPQKEATDNG